VEVAGISDAVYLALGDRHSCARLASAWVMCWGDNDKQQRGDEATAPSFKPVMVPRITAVIGLAANMENTCAILAGTTPPVFCWGANLAGQVAIGTSTDHEPPHVVTSAATAVTVGRYHACVLDEGGVVKCWGALREGLDPDPALKAFAPTTVSGLGGASAVAASIHTCAVVSDGRVQCLGDNHAGQLGDGSTTSSPTPVTVLAP
jgi:alpha-tubulin suppressor-like RCC1 family protein